MNSLPRDIAVSYHYLVSLKHKPRLNKFLCEAGLL